MIRAEIDTHINKHKRDNKKWVTRGKPAYIAHKGPTYPHSDWSPESLNIIRSKWIRLADSEAGLDVYISNKFSKWMITNTTKMTQRSYGGWENANRIQDHKGNNTNIILDEEFQDRSMKLDKKVNFITQKTQCTMKKWLYKTEEIHVKLFHL